MKTNLIIVLFGALFILADCSAVSHPDPDPTVPDPDPAVQVCKKVSEGDYSFLGLLVIDKSINCIPGIEKFKKRPDSDIRSDVEWHCIKDLNDPYVTIAEPYMRKYNLLMLLARKTIKLDIYGRGPENKNYSGYIRPN